MYYRICLLAILLSAVCGSTTANNATVLMENIPVNGTIQSGVDLTFTAPYVGDLQFFAYGFMAFRMNSTDPGKVGEVIITCDSTTFSLALDNGISVSHYYESTHCGDGGITVLLKNIANEALHYWLIVPSIDSSMYTIPAEDKMYVALPGHSTSEFLSLRGYIGVDDHSGGAVDFIQIQIHYTVYSDTKIKGFVANGQRPVEKQKIDLELKGDMLFANIQRSSPVFCLDCYLYICILVEEAKDQIVYLTPSFVVDRGVTHLYENKEETKNVMPDNHGVHFILDLRELEYDSDIVITLQKTNEPAIPLYADLALTSFDDGEWDKVDSITVSGMNTIQWNISRQAEWFTVGGMYYLRVMSADSIQTSCGIKIMYMFAGVKYEYLYTGKSIMSVTPDNRLSMTYYKIVIPKESFVDIQYVKITLSQIQYTWHKNPPYAMGFDLYVGRAKSYSLINNPKDKNSYSYTASIRAAMNYDMMFTENQMGWCSDCTFGLSMRSTNETHWKITAELGYVMSGLTPNIPKKGTLHGHTGGMILLFHLYQSQYEDIEVSVKKTTLTQPDVLMYVSTIPNPSKDNHMWMDSTEADGEAEETISRDHPSYCSNCKYYIGIYFVHEDQDGDTDLEVTIRCPNNVCRTCSGGYDPSRNCEECFPGYYGKYCRECGDCGHGTCNDGVAGDGKCTCKEGWVPAGQCTECDDEHYGLNCEKCPSCYNHGYCDAGLSGSGICICNSGFDSRINCENCERGRYGTRCSAICPNTNNTICSDHGSCDDGTYGTGRCMCQSGFVGIRCDTLYKDDKCSPHCMQGKGACNEEEGECICWDDNEGEDCSKQHGSGWIATAIVFICITSVLVLIIILYNAFSLVNMVRRRSKAMKDSLLGNPEEQFTSITVCFYLLLHSS